MNRFRLRHRLRTGIWLLPLLSLVTRFAAPSRARA
jgi:hypothetical protein